MILAGLCRFLDRANRPKRLGIGFLRIRQHLLSFGLFNFLAVTQHLDAPILRGFIDRLSNGAWLGLCVAITLVIATIAYLAGRIVDRNPPDRAPQSSASEPAAPAASAEPKANPAIAGGKLALRSRYLLSIVAFVGLYEIASTVMDFQFTATLEHYANLGEIKFKEQLATVYSITNAASMAIQLLLTGLIMTRFRLTVALLILPVAALSGSALFMALPLLWCGSLLNTADNALSYSVNQSAKEALYTVTSRSEKYQAKAFIDMFVQRLAKAMAVGVSLGVTLFFSDFSSVRWLGFFTATIVVIWMVAARYAGGRFHELAKATDRGG